MGPTIFLALVVAAAAATAAVYDQSQPIYDQENKIDIFLPEALNKLQDNRERALRSHYYNYLLYPGLAIASRAAMMAGPVFMTDAWVDPLTFQDVFEKPVMVVTPSPDSPHAFSIFYLHYGLRSIHRYKAFAWLQEFLKHPGLKGLIFYPRLVYNARFFETPIRNVIVQEDMRMSDFTSIHSQSQIPYMFVAPEEIFDRMHFENIAKVSDFKVYKDVIEAYPVNYRPSYEPFYGPSAAPATPVASAALQQQAVPSHQSPAAEPSSQDGWGYRSLDYQSQKLANQRGNVYGEIGHQFAGEYPEYDEGYNGGVADEEYLNYANVQIPQQVYQPFARGQVFQDSENRELTGGPLNLVAPSYRYDVEGSVGRKEVIASLQPEAISSANLQNQGLLRADGQVKYYGASKGSGFITPKTQVEQASQASVSQAQASVSQGQTSVSQAQAGRTTEQQAVKASKEVSTVESATHSGALEAHSTGSAANSLSRAQSGSWTQEVTGTQHGHQVSTAASAQREAVEPSVQRSEPASNAAILAGQASESKSLAVSGTTQQSNQVQRVEGSTGASIDVHGGISGQVGLHAGQRSDLVFPEGDVTGNVAQFLRSTIDATTQHVLAHRLPGQAHAESGAFVHSTLSPFLPSSSSAPRSLPSETPKTPNPTPNVLVGNVEPQVMTQVISA